MFTKVAFACVTSSSQPSSNWINLANEATDFLIPVLGILSIVSALYFGLRYLYLKLLTDKTATKSGKLFFWALGTLLVATLMGGIVEISLATQCI